LRLTGPDHLPPKEHRRCYLTTPGGEDPIIIVVADSVVQQLTPNIAYSQEAFLSPPLSTEDQFQSYVVTDSTTGVQYLYEVTLGTVGQRLNMSITRLTDSFQIFDGFWYWASDGAGGIALTSAVFRGYTPEGLVKTTLTMSTTTTWIFSQQTAMPWTVVHAGLGWVGSSLVDILLPTPLCAQGLSFTCRFWLATAAGAAAAITASAWTAVTAPNPGSVFAFIGSFAAGVGATFMIREHCPRIYIVY
jgi:hypothetical protein